MTISFCLHSIKFTWRKSYPNLEIQSGNFVSHMNSCKLGKTMGCHQSSVDSSVPSIVPTQVRGPSTQSTLLSSIVKVCAIFVFAMWKERKINKTETGIGPLKTLNLAKQVQTRTLLCLTVRSYVPSGIDNYAIFG